MSKKLSYEQILKNLQNNIKHLNTILFNSLSMKFTTYDKILEDGSFLYDTKYWHDFNVLKFRSEEFKKIHDGKHILFMGCSETEGSNHGLDETWAFILYNKIKLNEKLSGYFNISKIGVGIDLQILNLLEYIDKFSKPDEIFFLVPETIRSFNTVKNENLNIEINYTNFHGREDEYETEIISDTHLKNIIFLRFLESFCKNSNIKLIWSTWNPELENVFLQLNFENYLNLNCNFMDEIIKKNFELYADQNKSVEYNLMKKDGHKGLFFHNYWATMFYNRRENEKNIKKN